MANKLTTRISLIIVISAILVATFLFTYFSLSEAGIYGIKKVTEISDNVGNLNSTTPSSYIFNFFALEIFAAIAILLAIYLQLRTKKRK